MSAPTRTAADRIADYAAGVRTMAPVADYLTINISSPNTPGLARAAGRRRARRAACGGQVGGLGQADLPQGRARPRRRRSRADRPGGARSQDRCASSSPTRRFRGRPLKSRYAGEAGGLSGAPLKPLALEALRSFRRASGGEIPLIGVGGIANADDAWERIRAGASLVQLYSAMVYEGPGIARRIARGLAARLAARRACAALPRRSGPSSRFARCVTRLLAFSAAARARGLRQCPAHSTAAAPLAGWSAPPIRARRRPESRCCAKAEARPTRRSRPCSR